MQKTTFKQDKGQAGLSILLSVVVMLFMIGLLVMIFSLMSGEMQDTDSLYSTSSTTAVVNETQTTPTTAGITLATAVGKRDVVCSSVVCWNLTGVGTAITGNATVTNCLLQNKTSTYSNWRCTYNYVYQYDRAGAVNVINDTSSSIGGVTDWFDIFVVITAMVVLILLTVIIITSIRSSGMVSGGQTTGANSVGTA